MTDEELERLLGRHHPVGPDPLLRGRILDAATPHLRRVRLGVVDYALAGAAAALLATAMILEAPAVSLPIEVSRDREVLDLAEARDGGP